VSADKPKGPPKPFLGDEELSSELDAWDDMFDNLHAGDETGTPPPEEKPSWPVPDRAATLPSPPPAEASRVPDPALGVSDGSHTLDDFAPAFEARPDGELEEQMTLDRAISGEPPPSTKSSKFDAWEEPANETDFSDVSSERKASGGSGDLPVFDDTSDAGETRLDVNLRARSPSDDEEEVYTSASRPNVKPSPSATPLHDDPIAPPPKPSTVKRTGPAIIRRQTPLSVPINQPQPGKTPQRGYPAQSDPSSDFAESTRVADFGDMEARAKQSRGHDARSKAPTAPPPMSFTPSAYVDPAPPEDDYEIEIGANDDSPPPPPPPSDAITPPTSAPRRTVATLVRRDVPAKSQTMPPPRPQSDPVLEYEQSQTPPPPAAPAGEDDFSDVAAAVGAEDGQLDEIPMPPRAPVISARPATAEPDEDDILDAEPAEIDDALPTGLLPDVVAPTPSGDAYVPMAPPDFRNDEESVPQIADDDLGVAAPAAQSDRPPALMDLYPRVKRPTSVPVMGDRPAAGDPSSMASMAAVREPQRPVTPPPPVYVDEGSEIEPQIDLDTIGVDSQWPEQVQPLGSRVLDEDAASMLAVLEREIPTVDDPTVSASLRIEAGRLCERLGEPDRARDHYDSALLADPRATAALRGLRRIARSRGDLVEATRQLDAEIAVAGALERRPLGHYRVDLLMASGEHDLARVAVGELIDAAPSDVRALLAQLELAFVDGRAEEFGRALEQLAHAVTDNELRAAVQQARGMLAAHQNDMAGAATWLAAASEADPGSLGARLASIRDAASQNKATEAATALMELARIVEETDPATAAACALRAQHWVGGELAASAAQLAQRALPADPLVARIAAETAIASGDRIAMTEALTSWASCAAPRAERAYAAARAAELDPVHGVDLWTQAIKHDPGDDYAAAQLRTLHVAGERIDLAILVDLEVSESDRERARLRAAFGLIAQGQLDAAIDVLGKAHADRPVSLALAEALVEALAAAGRWTARAALLGELAVTPGEQLDRDVAQLRSALAWEEAVGAAAAAEPVDTAEVQRATAAALGAWEKVIEQAQGAAPEAHAAAIVLATRLGDKDVLGEALGRAQAAEKSPWAATSLALRRARIIATDDPARADTLLGEVAPQLDDPRRTVMQMLAAARRNDLGDVATTLEERADRLRETPEAAALRLRAAQLALDANDATRATTLLRQAEKGMPGVASVSDLLTAARRRAGDVSGPVRTPKQGTGPASADEFARTVRDADDAFARGDGATALGLYQSALEMRPGDPLAALPMIRVAAQLREPAPVAALALAQLRAAEAAGDGAAKAEAYELLSHIDRELRSDLGSAQIALESASQADPTRIDLMHRLEREYAVADQTGELLRLRRAELEQIPAELTADRAAMIMDTAILVERDSRPDAELVELYREALAADPKRRMALLYLESIVRRAGASEEQARLEELIAAYFEGDARTQAAFFTRAGETLAELGQIDGAVQKFGKADEVSPGHVPALEGWRQAALKGQLWLDVAEAATRQASIGGEPHARAALHHFAGVALMDKALIGEQAMAAFRRSLEADPAHRDSFLRLRILLEEEGNHDELAILIANRLEHEQPSAYKNELHRALAQLSRNFLGDRDTAKKHFRAILESDPNDIRAHSEVADIAWEQGEWQEAADALIGRARLERDPEILRNLCYRLGLIYADKLVDVPMALKAFQRALTYNPDDIQTLERLADLASQAGEWKLALGACERLVKAEADPDRRAQHLHRVARIFRQGFGDAKRAERALNLALDAAPTNDEALSELVRFYRDMNDMTSVRVHLNRVAGTMRVRAANDPRDGVAYRVISRAMAARAAVGVNGSLAVARAGAELATLLGAAAEPERMLLAEPTRVDLSPLLRAEADEVLFPRGVQTELRQIFTLLGDRVAKHVGVDLRAYGVGRGDRLRARDSAVAAHAQDVATGLGFGEIDVYVSARVPFAMVAEPTSPASLVIGQAIAQGDSKAVRFAAGAALKLAQAHLAIPARLPADELGILAVALLRQFQEKFPSAGLDEAAIATQIQKLKRLIPTNLASELRPYAFAIDPSQFSYQGLSRDLRIAGLRAGLIAGGSLVAGLGVLATQAGTDVPSFLADPVAQGLITFALGEDHATLSR
jgi:tetratricopeptide (TPR) repeat protein